jgi:hypothetical protein
MARNGRLGGLDYFALAFCGRLAGAGDSFFSLARCARLIEPPKFSSFCHRHPQAKAQFQPALFREGGLDHARNHCRIRNPGGPERFG